MGFQNRYVDEKIIKTYFDIGKPLTVLFRNETLILEDKVSSLVYELYSGGVSDEEIKKLIYKQ